ncbi:MAG: hypothetical protein A2X86_12730 [Bdellovibrionales bacterium GWA2_49_15]|nr:MAG: hypothetical protein A2X86_12730 [Bdellovibrionales bacterium GWA2_49_15]HAZ14718.1 hypothetical protein [Bdellovibrionales bacterium]
MFPIEIDDSEAIPVYLQIIQQIFGGIQSGKLKGGHLLPSIRQLAHDLEINPNTVAKAYKTLEENHIILTAGRKGTVIRNEALENLQTHTTSIAQHKMADLFNELRAMGIKKEKLEEIVTKLLQEKR